MGVHVYLYRIGKTIVPDGKYHYGSALREYTDVDQEFQWDILRHSGDSELQKIEGIEYEELRIDETRSVMRPKDVEAYRSALLKKFDFNESRWNQLCDVLKANSDVWVYMSW